MANSISRMHGSEESGFDVIEASLDTFAGGLVDVVNGSCTLHGGYLNVASGTDFILIYDDENPSLGSTAPDFQFPTSTDISFDILEGGGFTNGLTIAAADVGGTACSTNPGAANTAKLVVEL